MASLSRRSVLIAGTGAVVAGLSARALSAYAAPVEQGVTFRLDGLVLDGGEQVTSISLDTTGLATPVLPESLNAGTFTVRAQGVSPVASAGEVSGVFDVVRPVRRARVNRRGEIQLDLAYGEGVAGANTLGYLQERERNVVLGLTYTVTQNAPVTIANGDTVTFNQFTQAPVSNDETRAFTAHESAGLKYRLFSPPAASGARPLVVWLHGAGEGASLADGYYDNDTTLRANRGALGFATRQAQNAFGGAYVVAPQSTSFWMEDGDRFAPQIRQIIDELVASQPIDRSRIYVAGASNGGYMSMKLTSLYPDLFAASVPICGVVQPLVDGGPRLITDDQLRAISTPTWLVASRDDGVIPPETNTVLARDLIPGARMSLYNRVVRNGVRYNGHFSWIYVARNEPRINGTSIWQWMAAQHR